MRKTSFHIVVLGGDGIGPEVTEQTLRLLREIESNLTGVSFQFSEFAVGATEYLKNGDSFPGAAWDACKQCDAILLGAMGLPDVRYPNGKEIAPQLDLREKLELYGGVRPVRLYHENDTPLKTYGPGDIDFVLIRESTEGLFYGRDSIADLDAAEATNTLRVSRIGTERVCRLAFETARDRDTAQTGYAD